MTPAEATAEELVRAADRSATALRAVVREIPVSAVPTVLEALARAVIGYRSALIDAPTFTDWAPGDARKAHARYARGMRDVWTVTGERSYQRLRKRHSRVGCPQIAELSSAPALTCSDAGPPQDVHRSPPQPVDLMHNGSTAPVYGGLSNDGERCNSALMDQRHEKRAG